LTAADGRNITLAFGGTLTADSTGLAEGLPTTYAGGFTLVANSDVDLIEISGTDVANAGLLAGTYDPGVASTSSKVVTAADGAGATAAVLNAGDLVINGVSIAAANAADDTASFESTTSTKTGSAIAIAAAINKSSDSTGVTATANANIIAGTQGTPVAGSATLTVNGIGVGLTATTDAANNRAVAVAAINNVAGQTGVTAEDNGDGITLTAADGRNITLVATGPDLLTVDDDYGIGNVGITTYSSVSLSAGGLFTVAGGTNGNDDLEAIGFSAGTFGGAESGQFLKDVDISTQKGANAALAAIDNALNSISGARANLGAIQNRFETTISNLAVSAENLTTSNSRIKDADFASEAAALARSQVLQQAGISVLSQANAGPEQVLSLLQ
jgi:flagellin